MGLRRNKCSKSSQRAYRLVKEHTLDLEGVFVFLRNLPKHPNTSFREGYPSFSRLLQEGSMGYPWFLSFLAPQLRLRVSLVRLLGCGVVGSPGTMTGPPPGTAGTATAVWAST